MAIEIFFRQPKGNLGLNKYQVRSAQAIDRMLVLIALTYLYSVIGTGSYQQFGIGLRKVRILLVSQGLSIYTKA